MKVCDLAEEQIIVGMRVAHPKEKANSKGRKGTITTVDYVDDRYAWITWDGDKFETSGFWGNVCDLEVIGGYGDRDMTQATNAGVLLFNEQDEQILAVSRRNNVFDRGLPCGKIEPNEIPIQAAIRECKEETGIQLDPRRLHIALVRNGRWGDRGATATFVGMIRKNTPLLSGEEGIAAWVDQNEICDGSFGRYNTRLLEVVKRPHELTHQYWL